MKNARHGFSLRSFLIFVALAAIPCWGFHWIITPRVSDAKVQRYLDEILPSGTPLEVARKFFEHHYQYPQEFNDSQGHCVIECWVIDSGPPSAFMPDDIRINIFFDDNMRLTKCIAATESRF